MPPAVVFFVLRLAILWSAGDRLGHLGEAELDHADLAWDLLTPGAKVRPLWEYQVVGFHGGTLVSSLLYVPWAMVFGLSVVSLKGMALAIAGAALGVWVRAVYLWRGLAAAAVFAWLYALAPPVLVRMQLTLWGTHCESNLVLGLGVWAVVAGASSAPQRRGAWAFTLGAIVGLAVFWNRANLVFAALALVAGVWAFRSSDPDSAGTLRRRTLVPMLLVGLLLGLSPLALTSLLGQGSVRVYDQPWGRLLQGASERLPQWGSRMLVIPPFSPQLGPSPIPDPRLAVPIHFALLALSFSLLRHAVRRGCSTPDRTLSALLGGYHLVFGTALVAVHLPYSTFDSGLLGYCPRYAATLYPVLMASVGAWAARPGWSRFTGAALVITLAGPALRDDLALIEPQTPFAFREADTLRLWRRGLHGVDRRSAVGLSEFLERVDQDRTSEGVVRGVYAVLDRPWSRDYWRFLTLPTDGPTDWELSRRLSEAWQGGDLDPAFAIGLEWGRRIALGGRGSSAIPEGALREPPIR